jgi:ssDNA thymidine ADP-ribosyltransferase, DarT
MPANDDPAIYHITHVDNLGSIIRAGGLWCDARRRAQNFQVRNIAYEHLKLRRMQRPIPVAAGGFLGDYVPFNFCPRSVMLYPVHKGHDLYSGGQASVVHLVSSARTAAGAARPWAFTDRHAELGAALYFDDLDDLDQIDWNAVGATQWGGYGNRIVKECKQAEFLVHESFPWTSISSIGVHNKLMQQQVQLIIATAKHQPPVQVAPTWYY